MSDKVGKNYYLKGTKQRFKIIDRDLGGRYYLVPFKYLRTAYQNYLQKRVTPKELEENYTEIKN